MLHRIDYGMNLYTRGGERKYINAEERLRFLQAAEVEDPRLKTLCMTLVYTGCRISEALALTRHHIQPGARIISIRTLKKRGLVVVREVPVPCELISELFDVHGTGQTIHPENAPEGRETQERMWPWCRTKAWKRIKDVMKSANISGPHATPKGLRHGFGVQAVQSGVPLNLVQRWLGHAHLSTTAIYADAVGPEEYAIARRMWY